MTDWERLSFKKETLFPDALKLIEMVPDLKKLKVLTLLNLLWCKKINRKLRSVYDY